MSDQQPPKPATARVQLRRLEGRKLDPQGWACLAIAAISAIAEVAEAIRDGVDELHTLREIIDSKGRDG